MSKRILVILGHPSHDSFCGALTERYVQAAKDAGHQVRELRLGSLDFDPILREGYRQVQPLEADLLQAQADITWAEHLTFGPILGSTERQRETWLKQAQAIAAG